MSFPDHSGNRSLGGRRPIGCLGRVALNIEDPEAKGNHELHWVSEPAIQVASEVKVSADSDRWLVACPAQALALPSLIPKCQFHSIP